MRLSPFPENCFLLYRPAHNRLSTPCAYLRTLLRPYVGGLKSVKGRRDDISPGPETLLQDQLATCLAAMQDCLAHSRQPSADDENGHLRRHDLAYVAKLMKASARLTTALAKLKGDSRIMIHVSRSDTALGDSARSTDNRLVDKGEG